MSLHDIHNPVTAIAEIFADIRHTMEIPLITSIWRMLVDFKGALLPTWEATKLLYQTGQPQAALLKIQNEPSLPVPEPVNTNRLAAARVSKEDLKMILAILNAYNRSNGLNLIALTALTISPAGSLANDEVPASPQPWIPLPPLLEKRDIPESTWQVLVDVHKLSDDSGSPGIATIWRHLAHWPGLVELIYDGMAPLAREGKIELAKAKIQAIARSEGGRIAPLRPDTGSFDGVYIR